MSNTDDTLQLKSQVVGLLDALEKEIGADVLLADAAIQVVSSRTFEDKASFVTHLKSVLADFTIAELSGNKERLQQERVNLEQVVAKAERYLHVLAGLHGFLKNGWTDGSYAWRNRIMELKLSQFDAETKWKGKPEYKDLAAAWIEPIITLLPGLSEHVWRATGSKQEEKTGFLASILKSGGLIRYEIVKK